MRIGARSRHALHYLTSCLTTHHIPSFLISTLCLHQFHSPLLSLSLPLSISRRREAAGGHRMRSPAGCDSQRWRLRGLGRVSGSRRRNRAYGVCMRARDALPVKSCALSCFALLCIISWSHPSLACSFTIHHI